MNSIAQADIIQEKRTQYDAGERAYFTAMLEAERTGEAVDWDAVFGVMDSMAGAEFATAAAQSRDAADYPACCDGTF